MNADTIALAVSIAVLAFSIAVFAYAVRSGLRMKREYEASHAAHLARMKKYAPVQPRWGSDGVRLPSPSEAQEMRVQAQKESDDRRSRITDAMYADVGGTIPFHNPYTGGTAPLGKVVGGPWPLACTCPTCGPDREMMNAVARAVHDAESWESPHKQS